jgi:DNA polymerase elongation subunit (family B)
MSEYYSNVVVLGSKILYRGYKIEDGVKRRVHGKMDFKPTLYLEDKENQNTGFKSLFGVPLREKKFETIGEAKTFIKDYSSMMSIYGYKPNRFHHEFIAKAFPGKVEYLVGDLYCMGVDIETRVGVNGPPGVPSPVDAVEEITHFALEHYQSGKMVSYTTADISFSEKDGVPYIKFSDEATMLRAFIDYVKAEDPDIIYGFYASGFDFPYIINRIRRILGDAAVNELSPFGKVDVRDFEVNGKIAQDITIVGRTLYDTQALYKKIVLTKHESYSLDYLSKVELGEGKLENPCGTFKEFSESPEHVDRFAEYNVIDTKRMTQLDKKCGLMSTYILLSYLMKCTFDDVNSPVKYWECLILSTLMNENTFTKIESKQNATETIPGAFVTEPVPGFWEWMVSIDAASLYPSIMKCLNISPETFMGMVPGVTVEGQLEGKTIADYGITHDYTLAANGASFSKEKLGLVPRLVDFALDGRKKAKKEMLQHKQSYVDIKEELERRGIKVD